VHPDYVEARCNIFPIQNLTSQKVGHQVRADEADTSNSSAAARQDGHGRDERLGRPSLMRTLYSPSWVGRIVSMGAIVWALALVHVFIDSDESNSSTPATHLLRLR
jgi:hypothetical protein